MNYYLYIDDIRSDDKFYRTFSAASGVHWHPVILRSYDEFVKFLHHTFSYDTFFFDLDHDLGFDSDNKEYSGYDICKYIIENQIPIFGFHIHSMNPVGAQNMRQLLTHYGYKEY